jgi:hypothetical protein
MRYFLLTVLLFTSGVVFAGRVSGLVTDANNKVLPFASILIKGTAKGTTANQEGRYFITLDPGEYTIICQYVGYERQEKKITVRASDETLNFNLSLLQTSLKEVVVKAGAEDPAYEIIRNAIKKRSEHLNEIEKFQCEVYIKGMLKLRGYPKKLMGKDIDLGDNDTGRLKMIYLSETIATYAFQKPGKSKINVLSTKVSGQSDGFGLSAPQIISFYENNIPIGENLNPRGFVSPISDNALNFYKYKLLGVFFEDGKEINQVQVTARRKFEPLFSGIINITENDWRIHSLQLLLTKESQMDILDTLKVEQLYVQLHDKSWVIKNQVIYPAITFLGFDAYGSFVNVYSDFDVHPDFARDFFNNTILKFNDSANKRTPPYWDSVRPVPLQADEVKDYHRKDSIEQLRKSPEYLDSIDRKRNRFNFGEMLTTGQRFSKRKKRETYSFISLIDALNFNTVEGLVINFRATYTKRLDSSFLGEKVFQMTPNIRYGFTNHHLNAAMSSSYSYVRKYTSTITVAGGKDVFQFNNEHPIRARDNTLTTLLLEKNLMKIYEAWFASINVRKELGEGLTLTAAAKFQDRMPLDNTTDFVLREREKQVYTPNYPIELINTNISRHQALIGDVSVTWQPGAKYIEFPGRKLSIGSRYPQLTFSYTKGIDGLLGSDVHYDKWRFIISDDLKLKLAGKLDYRLSFGGFLNSRKVQVPDYQHFRGNQIVFASEYLNSFQLAPYYLNSTTAAFYSGLNFEYHLNGLLTNKLPLIRRLNWQLVTGTNAFYVNQNNNYVEVFAGFENMFRVLRVDLVQAFSAGNRAYSGIRIGLRGALFGN